MKNSNKADMRNAFGLLLIYCFTVVLSSCEKSEINTTIKINPWLQEKSGDELIRLYEDVVAYGFYADTAKWMVESYADAVLGIITSKENGSKQNYQFSAEPDEEGIIILGPFKYRKLMLIAVDKTTEIYGWRHASVAENLPDLLLSVIFCPYKTEAEYEWSKWNMVNENPPDPEEPEEPEEPEDPDNPDNPDNPE